MANEDESKYQTVAEKIGLGGKGGKAPTYGEADRNGYVGVSQEYANAANDTDLPLEATDDTDTEAQPESKATTTPSGTTAAPASTQNSTPSTSDE